MSEEPPGGVRLPPAEIAARWSPSWTPAEVASRLAGVTAPWYVAGGWALDLFRGRPTRAHDDLEIAVPAADFPQIRGCFPGYAFDAAGSGVIWPDAGPGELAATHQTWLRDPATDNYLLDVFREPHDAGTWICRREEQIRLPYREIIDRTPDGIPFLVPELVLLFKAKHVRPKDQADFDGVLPCMTAAQRGVLARLLALVHPGHPWLAGL